MEEQVLRDLIQLAEKAQALPKVFRSAGVAMWHNPQRLGPHNPIHLNAKHVDTNHVVRRVSLR